MSSTRQILHVIPYFTPKRGGDVNVCYTLSKYLVKGEHEVTIITTDFEFDEEYAKSVEKKGVKVIPFHCIVNISLFLFSPSIKKWLKGNIRKFDIVHLHDFRSYQNSVVHHYAQKYNIPYVLQAHGDVPYVNIKDRRKKFFDAFLGYRIVRDASKAIALTKTEAEQYKKMGMDENKIENISNGIDLSEYENLPKRGEFRRRYSIRNDEKMILYLGRIHKIKGLDLLVRAFADLIKDLDNVRLIIVGPDDGFLSTLKKQIANLKINDEVVFTGPLYERDKLKAYVDANVYVLPSVYEIFGITVIEACACGTPVIVTDRCSTADIVDKVGYVVEYNKDQLRDAIFKVLSDEELRRRLGEGGRRMVKEEFGWDKVVKEVERVYEEVVK